MGVHIVDFICLLVGQTGTSLVPLSVCLDEISIPKSYLHCVSIYLRVFQVVCFLWCGREFVAHSFIDLFGFTQLLFFFVCVCVCCLLLFIGIR